MKKYVLREDGLIAGFEIPEDYQINAEVQQKIRNQVTLEDELKARRIGGEFEASVNAHIEACVAEGRDRKAGVALLHEQFAVQLDDAEMAEAGLLSMLKDNLVAYAERIGLLDVAGTKQEIADRILVAARLKRDSH